MTNLPRYVKKITYSDGSARYFYKPPKKYVDMNLASRHKITPDLQAVCKTADEHNAKIDTWKRLYNGGKPLSGTSTIAQLLVRYQLSPAFEGLRAMARKEYSFIFPFLEEELSHWKIGKLTVPEAKGCYEKWLSRGHSMANKVAAVASVIFNFAVDMGYLPMNPFSRVSRPRPQLRKNVWTDEQVRQFLNTAYSEFRWRNFGLITHMVYAWVQKVGDIRLLTWDSIDWSKHTVTIEQSSHGATVILPIDDGLFAMLEQQFAEFGFQPYVAPKTKPRMGKYHAYHSQNMSGWTKEILKAAGLPLDLRISDLRRTGTLQMFAGDVSLPYVMLVTGLRTQKGLIDLTKAMEEDAGDALNKRAYT